MRRVVRHSAYQITCYAAIAASAVAFVTYNRVSAWTGKPDTAPAHGIGNESAAPTPDQAQLVVDDADLDLGTQYEADRYVHTFDVRNGSDQAITVTQWQSSCTCADVSPAPPLVFEPGETKRLTASFKLIPKKWPDDPSVGAPFGVRIYPTVHENGEDVKLGAWEFHCRILPTIHFNPPVLNLGLHSEKEEMIEGSTEVLALSDVRSVACVGNARWYVDVLPPDGARKSFRVMVRSKGCFQPEEMRESFTVTAVRENGDPLPVKELQMIGKIVRDVVADPPQVLFGRQACGDSGTETVSLRSLTGGCFQVRSVVCASEEVKVVPIGEGDQKYWLRVNFAHEGKQSANAKFVVRDFDGTEYEVAVPVCYYGVKK